MQNATVIISSHEWTVEVATTVSEIATGLSGRTALPTGTGMLFDLGSSVSSLTIDMSAMLFPIDVVFMDENARVLGIFYTVYPGESPATTTFVSDTGVRYFLEIPSGESVNINVNDIAQFTGYSGSDNITTGINLSLIISLMITLAIVSMMMKMMSGAMKEIK